MAVYEMRSSEATGIPGIKTGLRELCATLRQELAGHQSFGQARLVMYEVGSYAGASAAIFAEYFEELHCVDPWRKDLEPLMEPLVERMFDAVAKGMGNIRKHKTTSLEAARHVADGSLHFVYVDAGMHEWAQVWGDLEAWWPKVRQGCFLGGHDFQPGFPAVEKAVARLLDTEEDAHFLQLFADTSFLVQKKYLAKWIQPKR